MRTKRSPERPQVVVIFGSPEDYASNLLSSLSCRVQGESENILPNHCERQTHLSSHRNCSRQGYLYESISIQLLAENVNRHSRQDDMAYTSSPQPLAAMRRAQETFVNLHQAPSSQQVCLNPSTNESFSERPAETCSQNNNNNNNNEKMETTTTTATSKNRCACDCKPNGEKVLPTCDKTTRHPLDEANLLSKLFFVWMLPFVWRAYRRGLNKLSDLPSQPSADERCQSVGQTLALSWKRELAQCNWLSSSDVGERTRRPSLLRAVVRTHLRCIVSNSMLSFFAEVVCKSCSAFSVGQMLFYINNRDANQTIDQSNQTSTGWLSFLSIYQDPLVFWTTCLILSTCCWVLSAHYYGFQMMRVGLRLRIGCSYLIYLKSLRLGQFESTQSIMGKMTNLLSNDLDKFNFVCIMLPFLWIGPIQAVLSIVLLWPLLGFSCLASLLCILFILLPIQFYLSDKFASFRQRIARQTDHRVRLLNETISSIKLIKLCSWEMAFMRRLLGSRHLETRLIQRVANWKALSVALMYVSSKMVLFITILFHCLLFERPLDAKTLFMSMAMLNNVQFTMTQLLPRVISLGGESLVSLRRIGDFLLEVQFERSPHLWQNELHRRLTLSTGVVRSRPTLRGSMKLDDENENENKLDRNKLSPLVDSSSRRADWQDNRAFIHCQSIGASWPQAERKTLDSITFRCQAPELLVVSGQVGSGKSSLLLALLNELPVSEGSARISGQLAYCSQNAWIFNGTLRDNVLFGRQFNEQRYWQTIRACALSKDLELFEFGDQTYVHEESLSGGQKARVNLARCLYNNSSDIYLLDDPFSALDGRVGEQIFEEALLKLLKGKLILLATHQVRFLKRSDKILLLDEGKQLALCDYVHLGSMFMAPVGEHFTRKQHENVSFLAKCFNDDALLDSQTVDEQQVAPAAAAATPPTANRQQLVDKKSYFKSNLAEDRNQPKEESNNHDDYATFKSQARIWFKYYSLNSVWRLFFIILTFLVTQALFSTVDIYLTVWSMIEQNKALLVEITDSNQLWPSYIKHSLINRGYDKSSAQLDSSNVTASLISYDEIVNNLTDFNSDNNQNKSEAREDVESMPLIYNEASAHQLSHLIAHKANNNNVIGPLLDWIFYYSTSFEVDGKNVTLNGDLSDENGNDSLAAEDSNGLDNVSVINLDENILSESSQALNIKPIYRPLYLMIGNLSAGGHAIIYASLLLALFISSYITNVLSLSTSNNSARSLYKQLINSVMFAKMSYFDKNPIGRFLNRATRDLGIIDEAIPYNANQAYDALLQTAATFVVVTIVDFKLALPSLVILCVFVVFHSVQVAPTKDIQRLEGIARSPILTHISSTLNGLHTIRAGRAESRLEKLFVQYQDNHSSVMLFKLGCNRSTAVILDWFNALYVATIALVAVCSGDLSGPSAGLIITSAILLSGLSQHGMMKLIETESLMTSVERVLEYCRLPEEEPPVRRGQRRPNSVITGRLNEIIWPNKGVIEYKNVDLYYHDSDDRGQEAKPVLKNFSFKTRPGEKIGIIGRTGAGKSSIISTLFRLYPYEGLITLDGVDLSQLSLFELRNSIGIIPQQPVLFGSLSVRENLDPRGEFDDLAIWATLDKVHLRETISNLPGKLSFIIGEGGFSAGQKQLVCLARVLLRQSRIIVLDEATASVDATTDSIIQTLIRREFKHCTVLMIAHRLETILDCDRIMVLDSGQLMEFDSPERLASNEQSYFSRLMASAKVSAKS